MLNKSVISPMLVGRSDDLASLDQILSQAARGIGQIALLAGEAGIGKSRLVAEVIRRAEKLHARIYTGNCFETDRALPYGPFTDLLADNLAPLTREPDASAPVRSVESETDKRRLFRSLAESFSGDPAALQLIVIEDLHWCDDASLEFLLYLGRTIQKHSILLLGTYRDEEAPSLLRQFLAELNRTRSVAQFNLKRLSTKEADAMLRSIFELERPVRADFMKLLYDLTEGNPFFIEEILKSLIGSGEIFYAEGAWDRKPVDELHIPSTIQDAVQSRAKNLSARARETLVCAAVAGRRFNLELLKRETQLDEAGVVRVVKEMVDAQLVVEESADVFAFRHALTRQAVYSMLLRRERKQYHQRIAATLEEMYAGTTEAHLGELAYHFYEAEEWDRALDYSERAGRQAKGLYAPREAAEQFSHAIEAAKRLGATPPAPLLRESGEAYEMLGDFENAQTRLKEALDGARVTGDRDTEWSALVDLGKLWTSRDYAKSGEYYQAALAQAREMGDPTKIASSLNRIGNWHSNLDRPREAMAAHQEALSNFERLEDRRGIAETTDLLAMANWIGGDMSKATTLYHQAVSIFRETNDRQGLISSLATLALRSGKYKTETLVMPFGKLSDANADGEEALKVARAIDSRAGEAYALWTLGAALATQGEYGRALALVKESLAVAEEIEHEQWLTAAHCMLGGIYLDLFAVPDALVHLDRAVALAKEIGSTHWIRITSSRLAMTLIQQKDLARARAVLDEALPRDAPMDSVGKRECWLARGELALASGEVDAALIIADELIRSAAFDAERHANGKENVVPRLWKLRGDVLAAIDPARAEVVLLEGIEEAGAQGALPLLSQLLVSMGRLAPKANAEYFEKARACFDALASTIAHAKVKSEYQSRTAALLPSAATPSARQIAKKEYGGLTEREREIAAMIAQGKSNRAIAEALVVSERTIETHVRNVLTKLDFGSRAQIAAWATEKGLR